MKFSFLVFAIVLSLPVHARVFDMKEANLAPYVRGTFGNAWTHKEAYIHEVGSTTVDGSARYSYGGELGFLFRVAESANIRIGAELFQPKKITDETGTNSSGTELFKLNSSIFVFNPQLAVEILMKGTKTSRFLWTGGAGYATVSLKNEYAVTAAGQSALGLGSHTETGSATAINFFSSVGWEFLFTDRVMIMLEAGYRHFPVKGFKHSQAQSTFAQTSGAANGSDLLNKDGAVRKIDLSGAFIGLSFRFYVF